MQTRFLKNYFGFTLVGLMISVAITALVALGAAYVIVSSQQTGNFSSVQNEIDRLQYLNLQLSRNPAFILKLPGFEKTGALYQCLQHSGPSGVDCTQLRAPASYVTVNKVTGAAGSVVSTMAFQPNCNIPQACDSITVTTSTQMQQSSSSKNFLVSSGSFQPRKSVNVLPSYTLVPMTGFNFNCVLNQGLITALNYGNSQAVCQPLQGTLTTLTDPLANFGPLVPTTTQTMTKQNCGANGFSSIGSFQDQTNCMIPTVTTTTLMPPPGGPPPPGPPPPVTAPPTTLPPATYSATVLTKCMKSYRTSDPPAVKKIVGLFEAGSDNPARYTVVWSGISVGDPDCPSCSVSAKPWTNPTPNQLSVAVQCPAGGAGNDWGYKALATDTMTGQVYKSVFTCMCNNLGP